MLLKSLETRECGKHGKVSRILGTHAGESDLSLAARTAGDFGRDSEFRRHGGIHKLSDELLLILISGEFAEHRRETDAVGSALLLGKIGQDRISHDPCLILLVRGSRILKIALGKLDLDSLVRCFVNHHAVIVPDGVYGNFVE